MKPWLDSTLCVCFPGSWTAEQSSSGSKDSFKITAVCVLPSFGFCFVSFLLFWVAICTQGQFILWSHMIWEAGKEWKAMVMAYSPLLPSDCSLCIFFFFYFCAALNNRDHVVKCDCVSGRYEWMCLYQFVSISWPHPTTLLFFCFGLCILYK